MKPGPGFFIAALLWLLLAAAAYFIPFLWIIWIAVGIGLVPFIAVDFLLLRIFTDRLKVSREISTSLAQGTVTKVRLLISRGNMTAHKEHIEGSAGAEFAFIPFRIRLFDIYPPGMECEGIFPAVLSRRLFKDKRLIRNKGSSVIFDYSLTPQERGPWVFPGTELLLASPLRFWELKVFHKCESRGKTYPDFNKIKTGADLRFLLEMTGVKNIRRRGQGMDFRGLRDYQDGDTIRDIDWRATSRRRGMGGHPKLTVREYQEEQDQQVLFLLDSGYRLHRRESESGPGYGRTQFDSALEAILLLSWVSLKHGDSVAAAVFGSANRWLAPRKGMSAFPLLMNALYDLSSSAAPSSPFSCLEEALGKLKRRTFIILISNFREEDGESLSWILKRVEKRHLLLLVSLKEKEAEALVVRQPGNAEEALETAAAFSYLNTRRELYQSWEHLGLLTLEASSQTLSPALINRYLEVKRSGRL
jgi:uncharacterized protein (DUF58 family)